MVLLGRNSSRPLRRLVALAAIAALLIPTAIITSCEVDDIDLSQVTWLHTDASNFAVTATLEDIRIEGLTISWQWTQPGWPIPYSKGVLGNMWVFAVINGRWYAATWEWLRSSTNRSTLEAYPGQPPFIQSKAYPINEWYPKSGEVIGFMVSTPTRQGIPPHSPCERSPVVLTRWP